MQGELNLIVTLEIVFSGLFSIDRPSCRHHNHRKVVPQWSAENVAGLRRLMDGGVEVRPFQEQDWRDLATVLFPGDPDRAEALAQGAISQRQTEDANMRYDFNHYFGEGM